MSGGLNSYNKFLFVTTDDESKVEISRIILKKWLVINNLKMNGEIDIAPGNYINHILFDKYMVMKGFGSFLKMSCCLFKSRLINGTHMNMLTKVF